MLYIERLTSKMMKTEVKRNECVYCRVVHKKDRCCPVARKACNENYHVRYSMVQEERPDFRGLTLPEMRWIASELATYKNATVTPWEVLYILKLGGKEKKNARRAFNKKMERCPISLDLSKSEIKKELLKRWDEYQSSFRDQISAGPPPMDLPTFECYVCDKVFDEKEQYWDRLTSKWEIRDKHLSHDDKDEDGNALCMLCYIR